MSKLKSVEVKAEDIKLCLCQFPKEVRDYMSADRILANASMLSKMQGALARQIEAQGGDPMIAPARQFEDLMSALLVLWLRYKHQAIDAGKPDMAPDAMLAALMAMIHASCEGELQAVDLSEEPQMPAVMKGSVH